MYSLSETNLMWFALQGKRRLQMKSLQKAVSSLVPQNASSLLEGC